MRSTASLLATVLILALCYAGIASAQLIEVLSFGDSITQGVKVDSDGNISGITSPLHGARSWDGGYEPELEAIFAAQNRYRAFIYNWGYGGELTRDGVNRIDKVLNHLSADFILIMEGVNDLRSGISFSATIDNLEIMIRKSWEKNTKAVIATITPNPSHSNGQLIPDYYNPAIYELALNWHIAVADQYAALIGNWSNYHSGDDLHLNDEGEEIMAQVWFDAILKSGLPTRWIVPEDVKLTTSKHDGNFGGYPQMNAWIQVNGCEGYHVCDYSEVSGWLQTHGDSVFTENCWINSPGVYYGAGSGNNGDCLGWSSSGNDRVGTIIARSANRSFPGRHYCNRTFKVACCK